MDHVQPQLQHDALGMRFLSVTKPGILFGNTVTACGGFFLASRHLPFHWELFILTLLGLGLIIASGCVCNNVIDRDIDPLMERTRDRPLAQGKMSPAFALVYAAVLGIAGVAVLGFGTNGLTVSAALLGWIVYVGAYSLAWKRRSPWGTLIGAVSGAVPPVVGYLAVTNHIDAAALTLFLILFFWQMPHFYAIAIYRLKDFKAAKIPVLPLRKGIPYTKRSMVVYILLFIVASVALAFIAHTGAFYFVLALVLGLIWLFLALQGFRTTADRSWARKVFLFSIINITLLSFGML